MTRWQEFPLRPHGRPWPGLNTRGGVIDPGGGFLEEGSINQIINEGDVLQKRKGFVRGLDERFTGVVCGLFRYTDECGREHLLVADESAINIRQPFSIPTFLGSDSFPSDSFEDELSTENWRNTGNYETSAGGLQLIASAPSLEMDSSPATRHLRWFKEAATPSYFVESSYAFDTGSSLQQVVSIVLKRQDSAWLIGDLVFDASEGTYKVVLRVRVGSSLSDLAVQALGGISQGEGLFRLQYDASTRTVTARVSPTGGATVTPSAELSELQDDALGQGTALGLAFSGSSRPLTRILEVTGGTI